VLAKRKHGFRPTVCLVLPCKGAETGLERNIEAALKQEYDDYRLIVVTDSQLDPAYQIASAVLSRNPERKSRLCTSESSTTASGKVAALLTALAEDRGRSEVYAFLDSDALISPTWLGDLVDPLKEDSIGATTGFRWYFPSEGGLWPHVEAAWNAAGTNLLFSNRYNFPWGGAMAVRAETLERIDIRRVWSDAVSDDMSLNSALKRHGYWICFLPQCTVATFTRDNLQAFLIWATRQTTLTRVYNNGLWRYAALAYGFFDFTFVLGIISAGLGVLVASSWFLPSALLLSPTALGTLRSFHRNTTFKRAMPQFREQFERAAYKEAIASLIVPWIMTYCIMKSSSIHEIEWRGRKYKLPE
jgi:ceramide glucosyltransferase